MGPPKLLHCRPRRNLSSPGASAAIDCLSMWTRRLVRVASLVNLCGVRETNRLGALFEQAQAAEEKGDIAEAERLYRVLMKCDPTDAAAPFNLGNMLRANGRKEAALQIR